MFFTNQINFIVEVYSGEAADSSDWKAGCDLSPGRVTFNQDFSIVKS